MSERLEGKQCILAALAARRRRIEVVLCAWNAKPENSAEVTELAARIGVPVRSVTPEEVDAASQGRTHGGLVAICSPLPQATEDDIMRIVSSVSSPLFIVLEGVEDEQNLGFVMRSALALGASAVLLKKFAWSFDSCAISRASAGAFELMPLVQFGKESDLIHKLKKSDFSIWGAIARSKKTMYDADFTGRCALVFGGEKRGISAALREECTGFFSIPMPHLGGGDAAKAVPTLSLSHASAIAIAEAMRQRTKGSS